MSINCSFIPVNWIYKISICKFFSLLDNPIKCSGYNVCQNWCETIKEQWNNESQGKSFAWDKRFYSLPHTHTDTNCIYVYVI